MAITLNKHAAMCEENAIARGKITLNSSARPLLYDISRNWRELLDATSMRHEGSEWNEKEELAAEIIISTITYLRRVGCSNIEQLIKDTLAKHGVKVK